MFLAMAQVFFAHQMRELINDGMPAVALLLYEEFNSNHLNAAICHVAFVAAREEGKKEDYLRSINNEAEKHDDINLFKAHFARDWALYFAEKGQTSKARELMLSIDLTGQNNYQTYLWDLAWHKINLYDRRFSEGLDGLKSLKRDLAVISDPQLKLDIRWWLFVAYLLNWKFTDAAAVARESLKDAKDTKSDRVKAWRVATLRFLPIVAQLLARAGLWWKLGLYRRRQNV